MLTLRQLEYIVAVDEERHFRKAAERVHVSQPSLSAQVSQLEERLGVELFVRSKRGVFPTPTGQELIARGRKILQEVEQFKEFAQRASHPLAGRIRFGTPPTLGPYLLPHIVPKLHTHFPDLKFIVKEGTPAEIQKMVDDGSLDLALTPLPLISNRLEQQTIFTERLSAGMTWDHELVDQAYISGEHLKGQKVLALIKGHHLHDQVRDICETYGAELLSDYEGSSLDALRHMVAMGAGISFFPQLYIISEIQGRRDLCVRNLECRSNTRDIAMIWRKDSQLKNELSAICDMFRAHIPGRASHD